MLLALNLIRTDGETQSRAALDKATYLEYADAMSEGAAFPPVTVFFDGSSYWLADGFHRFFAAKHIGFTDMPVDVKDGTQLDAQLHSFGVNADHGLRRSNADKRKAVTGALGHPVSCKWSDNQIAKHCGVHHSTVGDIRRSLAESASDGGARSERIFTTKHGTEAIMNTANIGKAPKVTSPPATPPAPEATPSAAQAPAAAAPEPAAPAVSDEEAAAFADDVDPAAELEAAQREIAELKAVIAADDKAAEVEKWRQMYMVAGQRQADLATDLSKSSRKLVITGEALKKIAKAVGRDDPGARKHDVDLLVRAVQALARQGAEA